MREIVPIEEIKDALLARIEDVVARFAPPAGRHYRNGHVYYTLNPGRADRSVGSFVVHMSGPQAGHWKDFATGDRGDLIDLIGLSLNLDKAGAFKAARDYLGLSTESPEDRRQREEAAARARARREAEAREQARRSEKARKAAAGLWLSGAPQLVGTPVAHYLAGRGIDLAVLSRIPGALRYHAETRYYWTEDLTDPETGEVRQMTRHRPMPAMLGAITRGKDIIGCHRTYLAIGPNGRWGKAPVTDAKKMFGDCMGGAIRLSGQLGPRGGHLKLTEAPEGARVYVTEGIENALSLMVLRALRGRPPAFVVAAGSIANMGQIELPAQVGEVVLAADHDEAQQARDMLARAVGFHAGQGRQVRLWRSDVPGEDLNDALRRALAAQDAGQDQAGAA